MLTGEHLGHVESGFGELGARKRELGEFEVVSAMGDVIEMYLQKNFLVGKLKQPLKLTAYTM